MSLNIIGYTRDCRTNTPVVYAEIFIKDYLTLVGTDIDKFEIQRKRVDPKKYTRLKEDIKKGALLPGITLAIDHLKVQSYLPLLESRKQKELEAALLGASDIYILDGLQRSYIIKDLIEEKFNFNPDQKLLLEIWFEKEINHLIYRLIVLNSGQKPMSMRHQVELLFMTLKNDLEKGINGLEIYLERDGTIRSHPKKFPFDRIVNGYYSFLTKSPEVERDNLVVKKMNEDEILSSEEDELNESYSLFVKYLKLYCDLDFEFYRIYNGHNTLGIFKNWLAEENTIKAFFASVGKFSSDAKKIHRVDNSIEKLVNLLKESSSTDDPIFLEEFKTIKSGIDSKKVNVGVGTRKLIMDGFREFFIGEGEESFLECWKTSAS
ncbi:MAG: hypothetical protein IPH66_10065 [Crocinitomicaceae bacterium]|nr:hypothetical protein [Crocinitomicaceae bacterium]